MEPLANRSQELKTFIEIVTGINPRRIFLIEGKSGSGKTNLLGQFIYQCPRHILCVAIDLKSAQSGIHYIFNTLRRRLGSQNFPHLDRQVQEFLRRDNINVTVSDNEMRGREQQIQVILNFERDTEKLLRVDESIRQFRLSAMKNALFQDLRPIKQPICLMFDTFNEASDELKSWLGGEFLSEVVDSPNLRIVIAGQQIPKPNIEWMNLYEYCCLEAINDVEEWWKFAQHQQLNCPRDAVKAITLTFDGNPDNIVKTLTAVAGKWEK